MRKLDTKLCTRQEALQVCWIDTKRVIIFCLFNATRKLDTRAFFKKPSIIVDWNCRPYLVSFFDKSIYSMLCKMWRCGVFISSHTWQLRMSMHYVAVRDIWSAWMCFIDVKLFKRNFSHFGKLFTNYSEDNIIFRYLLDNTWLKSCFIPNLKIPSACIFCSYVYHSKNFSLFLVLRWIPQLF